VPKKNGTINIKWVRSGIGFSREQKEVVRSIGLGHLNQVVERPDTTHFRGLVAKVSHLVEVVEPSGAPAWAGVPEYKILPAEAAPKKAGPPAKKIVKEAPAEAPPATKEREKAAAPRKKAVAAKAGGAKSSAKAAPAATEKPKAKRKPAAPKSAATAKKESKSKKGKK
jgi:large subunit ribosomal protein L30